MSRGADVSEAMRRFLLKHRDPEFKNNVLFRLAGRCDRAFPGKEKTLFTPDEQEEICSRFREGNDLIAMKYLGRGTLFRDHDIIREYWIPDERLIRRITAFFSAAYLTRHIPGARRVLYKIQGLVSKFRGQNR